MPLESETADSNTSQTETLSEAVARLSLSDNPNDRKKLIELFKIKGREIGANKMRMIMESAEHIKRERGITQKLK